VSEGGKAFMGRKGKGRGRFLVIGLSWGLHRDFMSLVKKRMFEMRGRGKNMGMTHGKPHRQQIGLTKTQQT